MKTPVIIKSFPDGLSIILDSELPFEELLLEVRKKFKESSRFFGEAKTVLSFEGRELSEEEEKKVVRVIEETTDLLILCILARDPEKNEPFLKAANQMMSDGRSQDGQFYRGTLRSGQTLETDVSIVVLGDVNPGARIISKGNVVVLGGLYGMAYAGGGGSGGSFIAALTMQPAQLRIGDAIMKCGEKPNKWIRNRSVPKIAYAEEDQIKIKPITKELLNDLPL